MTHQTQALKMMEGQFVAMRGVEDGTEASLGIALAPILTNLLDGLINKCFPGVSDGEVAEAIVNPSPAQERAFQRSCRRQANKEIKRNRNPDGQRVSVRRRNEMREELAVDLFESMSSTAQTKGIDGTTELVREMRAA